MCWGMNRAQSQAWSQPSETMVILFRPRFHKVRMADSRTVFTHYPPPPHLFNFKAPFLQVLGHAEGVNSESPSFA